MQKNKEPKIIYWNEKQLAFINATQKRKMFMGGRGVGKTTTDAGIWMQRAAAMPRSKSFLISATYNQILTKTLPAIEAKLKDCGWREGIHYVIGRKPPEHFDKPFSAPRKYENVFSVRNGFCVELISMDTPQTARGGSYQSGSVDEMLNLKESDYTQVIIPSLRPSLGDHRFKNCLQYLQVCFYSSIPRKTQSEWIYNYEEWSKVYPEEFFFIEANSWDNVAILGEDTLKSWEREMPWLEYQVEVMNRRLKAVESAFYNKFDRGLHTYSASFMYDIGERGWQTTDAIDQHYKPTELIELTFDFGGWINCALVFQEDRLKRTEYCLNYLYVKDEQGKIDELVEKFCNTYQKHKHKVVRFWGERMGIAKNALVSGNIYEFMREKFKQRGWEVIIMATIDNTKDQSVRHQVINDVLNETEGRNALLPHIKINEESCKNFIVAIETTDTRPDGSKDKSKEKDRAFPQELATHATDAFDYYLLQKYAARLGMQTRRSLTAHVG